MSVPGRIQCYPLTSARWKDFEILCGERGACGGCGCMWFRLPRSDFREQRGSGQQESHEAACRIQARRPACWLTRTAGRARGALLAPRETYRAFANSRILKPVDDQPVWSVVCFFAKPYRRGGLTAGLLNEDAKHARNQGARGLQKATR